MKHIEKRGNSGLHPRHYSEAFCSQAGPGPDGKLPASNEVLHSLMYVCCVSTLWNLLSILDRAMRMIQSLVGCLVIAEVVSRCRESMGLVCAV